MDRTLLSMSAKKKLSKANKCLQLRNCEHLSNQVTTWLMCLSGVSTDISSYQLVSQKG